MEIHIRRRQFIVTLGERGGVALAARAQQPAGMRRIGVLTAFAENYVII